MQIVYTTSSDPHFIKLCAALDEDLNHTIGSQKQADQYSQYNTLESIKEVVLALEDGEPIGCGAFKHYEKGIAEIKRVFVRPDHRGKGISKQIINALEEKARMQGYQKLILETGKRLVVATKLYKQMGFVIIDNYGPYKNLKESICMEKQL